MLTTIQSKRLVFTPFQPDDYHHYRRLVQEEQVMAYITGAPTPEEKAREEFDQILATYTLHPGFGKFAIRTLAEGHFVGLGKMDKVEEESAEVGYLLLPDFWGKGLGSEIAHRLVAYAREREGLDHLIGIIDPENAASQRILEKCGFTFSHSGTWRGLPSAYFKLKF